MLLNVLVLDGEIEKVRRVIVSFLEGLNSSDYLIRFPRSGRLCGIRTPLTMVQTLPMNGNHFL